MGSPDVLLIRWPDEDHRRPEHAGQARPTLLVIERGGPAPRRLGPLEDWVFHDAPPEEIALRVATVAGRVAETTEGPVLDDGILRHEERWTAVSDAQLPVVELLVDRFGRVVSNDELRAAYESAGGSTAGSSLRSLVYRLGQRFDEVGLTLRTVRGRGVVLAAAATGPGPS